MKSDYSSKLCCQFSTPCFQYLTQSNPYLVFDIYFTDSNKEVTHRCRDTSVSSLPLEQPISLDQTVKLSASECTSDQYVILHKEELTAHNLVGTSQALISL